MSDAVQVIGIGELLWDCFPDQQRPGGAPANVAFHAQQLGLRTAVATRIGNDLLGNALSEFLTDHGLSIELLQVDSVHPTGNVTLWKKLHGSMGYSFLDNTAWDFLEPDEKLIDAVRSAKAICFGTLGQRRPTSRHTIYQCLNAAIKECLIVYDVNLRPPFLVKDWIAKSLKYATIVKLNDEEVKVLSELFGFSADQNIAFAKRLLDDYENIQLVCITKGSEGCLAVSHNEMIELEGIPIQVADTVGAGDSFTAAMIYGHLTGWPLVKTLDLANHFGSLVASRPGAMPSLQNELATLKSQLEWSYRDTSV